MFFYTAMNCRAIFTASLRDARIHVPEGHPTIARKFTSVLKLTDFIVKVLNLSKDRHIRL